MRVCILCGLHIGNITLRTCMLANDYTYLCIGIDLICYKLFTGKKVEITAFLLLYTLTRIWMLRLEMGFFGIPLPMVGILLRSSYILQTVYKWWLMIYKG